ncbi:5-oxoprolinase subunit PxpB [Pseudomonas serbica]
MKFSIEPVAVDSLMIRLFDAIDEGNMPWILSVVKTLRCTLGDALIDLVPSYTTVMVQYDLHTMRPDEIAKRIKAALADVQPTLSASGRQHVIPVWYDIAVGPELSLVSGRSGLSVAEVIRLHTSKRYLVFALGFAPGFGFMGLLPEQLRSPRLATPRKRLPAGSVGIAELQTSIYPSPSPGGWNILGRTPERLFGADIPGFSLFQPGDEVRFEPIDRGEFLKRGGDITPLEPYHD